MNLSDREAMFKNDVDKFTEYGEKLRDQFFSYWSEPNKSKTKMRWELQRTWDIKRRLKTFSDNQKKWDGNSIQRTGKDAGAQQLLDELRADWRPE